MNQGQTNWPSKARIWLLSRQNSQATLTPMHQSVHHNNVKLHKQQLQFLFYILMSDLKAKTNIADPIFD
jgi:hypothetical protein